MKLKICTKCNCEKPESDFRVKRIGKDGLPVLRSDCRPCEWLSRSDEARERKRERERGKWGKNPEYAERQREYLKSPKRRGYINSYFAMLRETNKKEGLNFKQGKSCFFMVRRCVRCERVDPVKRVAPRGIGIKYCRSCASSVSTEGKVKPKKEVVCVDCNSVFAGAHNSKRCKQCVKRHKRLKYGGDSDHRKRARRYGVTYQPVNKQKVYERDEWRCYLCGCEVFRSKTYHPQQATVDCVIPLSKGGGYTYDNVKTCCMMCNASKSDSIFLHEAVASEGVRRPKKGLAFVPT